MDAVYTYCCIDGNEADEFTVMMAKLSVGAVKRFADMKTVLYTNVHSFDSVEFDDIIYCDFFTWNWDRRYWNIPKLMTYAKQESPFIHIDIDLHILPNFIVDSGADIICEKVRFISPSEQVYRHCTNPEFAACSGIMGTSTTKGLDYFKSLYEKSMLECKSGIYEDVSFYDLVSIEECHTYNHAIENKMSIYYPGFWTYCHYTGVDKKERYGIAVERAIKNLL